MKFELYKIFYRKTTLALFVGFFLLTLTTTLLSLRVDVWRAGNTPETVAASYWEWAMSDLEGTRYVIETYGMLGEFPGSYGGSLFPDGGRFIPFQTDVDSPIIQKLVGLYDQIEIPQGIVPNTAWGRIFGSGGMITFFLGVVILMGVAPVFADERSTGVDKTILTSQQGKNKVVINKIMASLIFTIVVYMVYFFAITIPNIFFYGANGLNAPIHLYFFFAQSPYNYTVAELLPRFIGVGLISSLFLCMKGLVVSALSRNAYIALVPSFLIYFLSSFRFVPTSGYQTGVLVELHRFITLFPANVLGDTQIWGTPDFYNIFGLFISRPAMTVIFSAVGICALAMSCFMITKRMEPSN